MNKLLILILSLGLISCSLPKEELPDDPNGDNPSTTELKVGAFNIQIFGVSKMSEPDVVNILVKTVGRYDLILIQEIRDSSGSAIVNFMEFLNDEFDNQYDFIISSRTGRTSSKEQYAYIYKKSLLEVVNTFEYDDGVEPDNDLFEREPYVALFRFIPTGDEFSAIALHSKPEDALNELNHLHSVYTYTEDLFNNNKSILLGDFNADCSYLSDANYQNLNIVTDSQFTWHISKSADTTVGTTNCAYDALVTTNSLTTRVKPGSVEIFNFQSTYNLLQTLAEDVSDHFPVGLTLSF